MARNSQDHKWRSFEEAREFARSLKLKNQKEWREYLQSGKKPKDIPYSPGRTYKNSGWKGLPDWLGNENQQFSKSNFMSFNDAKKFAQKLNLQSGTEWKKLGKDNKLPKNIPHDPARRYKKDWKGWKDYLGYEKQHVAKGEFRDFQSAKKFVVSLKLKNQKEWRKYIQSGGKPKDIPSAPDKTYPKNWTSWGDWLGSGFVHPKNLKFKNFQEAHEFVIKLNLKTNDDWIKYTKSGKKPKDIPTDVRHIYKENWKSMEHWLTGKDIPSRGNILLDFDDALIFTRKLKLTGKKEWENYIKSGKRPRNIPADPRGAYKNKGWISWNDWLGDGKVNPRTIKFKSYDDAKKIIKSFGIKSQSDWAKFAKTKQKPIDVPAQPRQYYQKDWKGWGDWLGTGTVSVIEKSKTWLPWPEAKLLYRKIAKENNLKNLADWIKYKKSHELPKGLPANPDDVYTKERVWKRMQK